MVKNALKIKNLYYENKEFEGKMKDVKKENFYSKNLFKIKNNNAKNTFYLFKNVQKKNFTIQKLI